LALPFCSGGKGSPEGSPTTTSTRLFGYTAVTVSKAAGDWDTGAIENGGVAPRRTDMLDLALVR